MNFVSFFTVANRMFSLVSLVLLLKRRLRAITQERLELYFFEIFHDMICIKYVISRENARTFCPQ